MRAYVKIIIMVLSIICGCFTHMPNVSIKINNIDIYNYEQDENIYKAINIVIEELDKEGIYTKEQMYNAIKNASSPLKIVFLNGVYNKDTKTYCIYKDDENLRNKCLAGYFSGSFQIEVIRTELLSNSAFAHEIFHYMQWHVGRESNTDHQPRHLWERLFGFNVLGIGKINEVLKKEGL